MGEPTTIKLLKYILKQHFGPYFLAFAIDLIKSFDIDNQHQIESLYFHPNRFISDKSVHIFKHKVEHLIIQDILQCNLIPFDHTHVQNSQDMLKTDLVLLLLILQHILDVLREVHQQYHSQRAHLQQSLHNKDDLV